MDDVPKDSPEWFRLKERELSQQWRLEAAAATADDVADEDEDNSDGESKQSAAAAASSSSVACAAANEMDLLPHDLIHRVSNSDDAPLPAAQI
eukprot:scaffold9368_cov22-Cyclotella_meneghiniana.AAC.1